MGVAAQIQATEVGHLPRDWSVAPLGHLLLGSPSYGINAAAQPLDSRLPTYLRITDISEDGRFIHETKASVAHPSAGEYSMRPGELVFARTGASVGKSYLYNSKDGALVYAGFLIRVRPDPQQLVPAYLRYVAQTRQYWNWVAMNSMRTGQPGLNGQQFARLPVPLPPTKAEQEAIAEALSDADALIESLEQLIAKKRLIKQGAMQELLTGKRRLPGFETKRGTHQTELGALPLDWSIATLGEQFSIRLGKMLDAQNNIGEPKPFLGNRSVQWGRIDVSDVGLMKMTPADQQQYRLREGDLLACEGGEVARCAIWRSELEECYYQKAIHRVRPRAGCSVEFLSQVLELHARRGVLDFYTTGTGIAHLPKDKFETVPIPLPPSSEERDAICRALSDMDTEVAAWVEKLTKARQIKQGMMHNLLTGKIRLV